jgi:hypothetical protein
MRGFLIALLCFAVVTLGMLLWKQEKTIEGQESEIHDLKINLGVSMQMTALDLQAKCAAQAGAMYKEGGYQSDQLASYSDHYNTALGKCFIFTVYNDFKTNPDGYYTSESLYDAFEQKDYGDFLELTYDDHSKTPILAQCTITLPNGTRAFCASEDEFKRAAEYFMGPGL